MQKLSRDEWDRLKRMGYPDVSGHEGIAVESMYRGGDSYIKDQLGEHGYLPHHVRDVIKMGIKAMEKDIIPLHDQEHIAGEIRKALHEQKGYSVISLGDGEMVAMAHDLLLPVEELVKNPRFVYPDLLKNSPEGHYPLLRTGITIPNHNVRDLLTANVLKADTVGIPVARYPTYQTLFNQLAAHHNWPLKDMTLTTSAIGYRLNDTPIYHELLEGHKVLLIGNVMKQAEDYFKAQGYTQIVGSIPVPGFDSYTAVLEKTKDYDFDVALVAGGVASNIISVELADQRKIAIDIGRLIDEWLSGQKTIQKK
ncbi:GT-D fold domain-containing protein [Salimicrobium halophilum]|uniref:GT-D fold-like domain-containing protein n=1 Tax=Salimicrobium halophilum TaxID=86666 RepID=A0A1G8UJ48_9BACI|nr:GT-D fold domain-containing glycosyltransferase [Salimicrobium halophilum]SDJ53205.1 hypothetical protein SAMN04490247_2267 [Salimicrobium halophilum]